MAGFCLEVELQHTGSVTDGLLLLVVCVKTVNGFFIKLKRFQRTNVFIFNEYK